MTEFYCQDCGHRFRTVKAAQKAAFGDNGCPRCGSSDVDVGPPPSRTEADVRREMAHGAVDRLLEIERQKREGKPLSHWGDETDPCRPEIGGEG